MILYNRVNNIKVKVHVILGIMKIGEIFCKLLIYRF